MSPLSPLYARFDKMKLNDESDDENLLLDDEEDSVAGNMREAVSKLEVRPSKTNT